MRLAPPRLHLNLHGAHADGRPLATSSEGKTLEGLLAAPVSAFAGVTDDDAEHLLAAFDIKTVAGLGTNRYFAAAPAMLALQPVTSGGRWR